VALEAFEFVDGTAVHAVGLGLIAEKEGELLTFRGGILEGAAGGVEGAGKLPGGVFEVA
jgi:hypothetical protein